MYLFCNFYFLQALYNITIIHNFTYFKGGIFIKRLNKIILLISFFIFIFIGLISCQNKETKSTDFTLDNFIDEMNSKGYDLKVKDVEKDVLSGTRKRTYNDKLIFDVYLYENNKSMESDSKNLSNDGSKYENSKTSVVVDWSNTPHFYKKGNIIVQYIGEDEKIISDLQSILGEQFAGHD